MYKNVEDLLEPDEQIPICNDCPHPNGCIRECIIEKHIHEDVAKIRDEEKPQ